MVHESKSLWRIKRHYKKNAKSCLSCQQFWEKLEKEKEDNLKDLEALLKEHLK
jgi:acid phosphatase class B